MFSHLALVRTTYLLRVTMNEVHNFHKNTNFRNQSLLWNILNLFSRWLKYYIYEASQPKNSQESNAFLNSLNFPSLPCCYAMFSQVQCGVSRGLAVVLWQQIRQRHAFSWLSTSACVSCWLKCFGFFAPNPWLQLCCVVVRKTLNFERIH